MLFSFGAFAKSLLKDLNQIVERYTITLKLIYK